MGKITPFLWFDDNAEEAINFYISTFENSEIVSVQRAESSDRGQEGSLVSATFRLDGLELMALNGGPHFSFTEAISLFVTCEGQAQVDELWEKLSQGGEKSQCGWLKDRYGLWWQIVPSALGELLKGEDAARSKRVMDALLQMGKIEIQALERAYRGE